MAKKLVIVESPAKAKTINKILGKEFGVASSMGHVMDLPASQFGVDVEHDFQPRYIVIQSRRKIVNQLKQEAKDKEAIYLAPDPDREGEAISWHLAQLLRGDQRKAPSSSKSSRKTASNGQQIFRVTFNEITPQAIKAAFRHPGQIDLNKVNAQQARRILDRLVGYSLSPLLWKKVGRGLSAGRVQSVALRLIVERERQIESFVPQESWTIEAKLRKIEGDQTPFVAQLEKIGTEKADLKTKGEAEAIAQELTRQTFQVASIDERKQSRHPKPPFTTSTLQQEAFHKLGFSAGRTMRIAQELYEGLDVGEESPVGLITYMRTDSVRVATEAITAVRALIARQFGKEFVPDDVRRYKARATAQEAHEAIRPTSAARLPEHVARYVSKDQLALYQLIWQRFVASQMADAVDEVVTVRIDAGLPAPRSSWQAGKFHLKATGRRVIFPGWTQVYQETEDKERDEEQADTGTLPALVKGEPLTLLGCTPTQHFTKPPRRYTDASLVKVLEEEGIGRPSTYVPIIQTLVERDYVRRVGGSFQPTPLGRIVTDLLTQHFPEVLDVKFTAEMEAQLDRIEEGELAWVSVVRHFYDPFSVRLAQAKMFMRDVKREVIPSGETCEQCGRPMVVKWGRHGQFLSCSGYPECKQAKPMPTGYSCPREGCGGQLIERRAKGRLFYGCSNYPTCTVTMRRLPRQEE